MNRKRKPRLGNLHKTTSLVYGHIAQFQLISMFTRVSDIDIRCIEVAGIS